MNKRIQVLIITAVMAIGAIGLAVALMQCGGQPTPAAGVSPTASGATEPATTPPPDTPTAEPSTPTSTPGPSPTPTLRPEVELARELIEPSGVITYSADGCSEIFETTSACHVIKSAAPITRPEWEKLFPKTDFYLVKYDEYLNTYPPSPPEPRRQLIIEQGDQRYSPDSFDRLLKANGITTITDENRELVAKALVLMTLSDYLEQEILFTDWGETQDGPIAIADLRYNYTMMLWTKIQGLKIRWWFLFIEGDLRDAAGGIVARETGDYIEVSHEKAPMYPNRAYTFWGN
jgi:hypothetical protein